MVFSSNIFLFAFLPLVLGIYYLTPSRYRNSLLFLVGLLFFFWGAGPVVVWLLGGVIINHYAAKWISASPEPKARRILSLTLVLNLGVLLYYKYFNFFCQQISMLLAGFRISWHSGWEVALPIGISFFIFKAMSYPIEVYRQVEKPAPKLVDFGAYLTLFPQLIAGPIARYSETRTDLLERKCSVNLFFAGLQRFALGLGKKVLIADSLGQVVNKIFKLGGGELTTPLAWLGIICYSFQIYYDFAGYTDMAIGIGRFLGFQFPENFNQPYRAINVTEFWRRWHITLSGWFRDFLFIPLEYKMARWWKSSASAKGGFASFWAERWHGRKGGAWRTYFNLLLVFSLCGLWHGAAWNFIVWGALHGFFMAVELGLKKRYKWQNAGVAGTVSTFFLIMLAWVFFRTESIGAAWLYINALFGLQSAVAAFQLFSFRYYLQNNTIFYLICAALFAWLPIERFENSDFWQRPVGVALTGMAALGLLFCSAFYLAGTGFNPFIYFRF
jgi:alginate O-acetyltransferase complex protein AlgI